MRITRVYTGAGDKGLTKLGDGSEVPKDHPRVLAYGAVDLANSAVGCARAELEDRELGSRRRQRWEERFQWILALALLGLMVEPLVSERIARSPR